MPPDGVMLSRQEQAGKSRRKRKTARERGRKKVAAVKVAALKVAAQKWSQNSGRKKVLPKQWQQNSGCKKVATKGVAAK